MDHRLGVWQHGGQGDDRAVEGFAQPSPVDAELHTSEYRTVAVYWTVPEAELARGMLVSDGIPVAFLDGADAALLPGAAPVRLLVPTSDLERSRLLLGEPRSPTLAAVAMCSPQIGVLDAAWSRLVLAVIGLSIAFAMLVAL
jgi:hypothetical protein